MNQKAFFIIFKGHYFKQENNFFFFAGESAALIYKINIVVRMSNQEDFHRPEKRLKKRGKLITKLEYQRKSK